MVEFVSAWVQIGTSLSSHESEVLLVVVPDQAQLPGAGCPLHEGKLATAGASTSSATACAES
jgi:hypothetical protein